MIHSELLLEKKVLDGRENAVRAWRPPAIGNPMVEPEVSRSCDISVRLQPWS
jgi:hypothetical protein